MASTLSSLVVTACAEAGEAAPPRISLATLPAAGTCIDWVGQPVERICIPRRARADVPLVLEAEERCGPCGATAERCTVTVEGRVVTLSLDGRTCEPPPGVACTSTCGKTRVRCELPPLSEGRYQVRSAESSGRTDTLDVVISPHAPTTCALEAPAR